MTTWSGFTNHLRIGYDVWTDGYDTWTPSINVYIQLHVQVDGSWNFNDSQTVNLSGSTGASWTFQNTMGANGVWDSPVAVIGGQGQSYGGGPTYSFHAQLDGNYLGAGPAIDWNFTLPARPIRAPSAPPAPDYNPVTASSANVTWGRPADEGGWASDYTWLQIGTSNFGNLIYDNQSPGWSGRSIGGLAPGTTYYGRVAAHNPAGWSGWSGVSGFTTSSYQQGTPGIGTVTATTVGLAWSAPNASPAPASYEAQVALDAGFGQVVATLYNLTGTSAVFSGLMPGTPHYFRTRANPSGGQGYGAWSPAASTTTNNYQLAAPTVSVQATSAVVTWGMPPTSDAPSQYQLQVSTVPNFASLVQTLTGAWVRTATVAGLTPGSTYYFRVRAYSAPGWGAWSGGTSTKTLSGAKILTGGVWKDAVAYIRTANGWQQVGAVSKRVDGAWKV